MKYLIVAAKTGGHIFPARAIAQELINNNHEIILLGIGNEIENKAFKGLDSKGYSISIDGFRGQKILKKLKVLIQTLISVFKVLEIIKKENIDAMIGFGGFICIPAGIAIWIRGLPIFIHEQNAIMGTANRILSNIAKINFLGFPIKQIKRSIVSGNPIRKSFINIDSDHLDYDQNKIRIYVTGGSQGANFINQEIPIVLNELSCNLKIKHQSGENNLNEVISLYNEENIEAEVFEFYDNPAEEILWSDFVISRAGALSLSEIVSLRRGALIIPLAKSIDNHQVENAKSIEKMNMGVLHQEKDGKEKLINRLQEVIEKKLYLNWKKYYINDHVNASKIILKHLEDYFKK